MITHQHDSNHISDAEWHFAAPYLWLPLPGDGRQRNHGPLDVFDGLQDIVRSGSPWRYLSKGLPDLGNRLSARPPMPVRRVLRGEHS